MQVKIFESTDMASGLKLVRQTLGPDALILSTRTIRGGKLGILGKPILEITAAIDSPAPGPSRAATGHSGPARGRLSQWVDDSPDQQGKTPSEPPKTYDSTLRLERKPCLAPDQPAPESELAELKAMVQLLGIEVARLGEERQTSEDREPKTNTNQAAASPMAMEQVADDGQRRQEEGDQERLLTELRGLGLGTQTAATMAGMCSSLDEEGSRDSDGQPSTRALQRVISRLTQVAPPLCRDPEKQRRIALIGPTGVGKTTTLAKVAAHYLTNFSSSIALITIDTYRIAAVEQLKVYGAIMNLPVEVVISPEELEQALQRHHQKELILIDTAGRSPKDSLGIRELTAFLRPDHGIDKHLVLSATTRESELLETIRRFSILGIDNAIITKTDECSTLGVLLELQMGERDDIIPFSWITNGQRVPEDLLTATPELVARLITTPPRATDDNQLEDGSNSTARATNIQHRR